MKLPRIPRDSDELRALPAFAMERSEVIDGELCFENPDGFAKAISDGFFLLKVPTEIELEAGDCFASNFFLPKSSDERLSGYQGYKDVRLEEAYQGYFDRSHDQWENFYIESKNWRKHLPPELCVLGRQMAGLGIAVLRNVLQHLGIPEHLWDETTGGLSQEQGHQMLAFNHFRSEKPRRGSKFHRDSGWVTILRSTEPGLVALVHGGLYAIDPVPGYFIVNFGRAIEVLTANLANAVRANIHAVARTVRKDGGKNRTSYVVFLDSSLSGNIYELIDTERTRFIESVADFGAREVQRTYDDNDDVL